MPDPLSYIPIVANQCFRDSSGALMARGQLTVQPSGPFSLPGEGQLSNAPLQRAILNGSMQGSLQLGNSLIASPPGVTWTFTIADLVTNHHQTYGNIIVTADSEGNFDLSGLQAGLCKTQDVDIDGSAYSLAQLLAAQAIAALTAALNESTGSVGPAPTLTVGTVTSLSAGASPTFQFVETAAGAYTVNIGIPAGTPGAPGASASTPTTAANAAGTRALAFASAGDICYDITLTADTAFTITAPSASAALRRLVLVVRPAGFNATFPVSSSALKWSGGSAPVQADTTSLIALTFVSTGTAPVLGGI